MSAITFFPVLSVKLTHNEKYLPVTAYAVCQKVMYRINSVLEADTKYCQENEFMVCTGRL
jgi:hypothetical protein